VIPPSMMLKVLQMPTKGLSALNAISISTLPLSVHIRRSPKWSSVMNYVDNADDKYITMSVTGTSYLDRAMT